MTDIGAGGHVPGGLSPHENSPRVSLVFGDVLTNPETNDKDEYARGNNRYLSPSLAFPALTVPAGFTTDGLPVGIEFMGRIFSEPTLFKLGYAYEQLQRKDLARQEYQQACHLKADLCQMINTR